MQFSLASIGFNMFPASIAPSVLPAPTIVKFVDKKYYLPSDLVISLRTAFSLSSNSPRIWPLQSAHPCQVAKWSCPSALRVHHLFSILWQGLQQRQSFLHLARRLIPIVFCSAWQIRITCLISWSLPITGSSFPALASSTRSLPYFCRAW